MGLALSIVTGVLGLAFVVGGIVKLLVPQDRFAAMSGAAAWARDFAPGTFKAIGLIEAIGGLGMVLPVWLDVAPILSPIAASGMALYMSGAATTRLRRAEYTALFGDLAFLGLCVFVAYGHFAAHAVRLST
jgi:hypothetical protein